MATEVKNKGGRPVGSVNALSAEAKRRAAESGLLPHEILLDMARGNPQTLKCIDPDTGEVREKQVALDLLEMKDAAKAAAPYYAAKLSAVELLQGIANDDLDQLIEELAAQAGVGSRARGESEADEEVEGTRGSGSSDARGAPSVRGPRRRVDI